ncbi:MAG: diacylglycerol kinase family lipid kinase [Acidobacteria bacterium]|nr:MAG: diacylglycerol kinase family lipid kinase [Acidobacteriota bacterium]
MRRAILIYNPTAGRRRAQGRLPAIVEALDAGGFDVEARPTAAPGDATRIARQAARGGVETVFALGGDGTLREAAAGLLGSDLELGFLPGGTVNVMALAFGLPRDALAAARRMGGLEARRVDVGLCGGEAFLMSFSAGFDAAVMAGQSPALKRRLGPPAVFLAGLACWWRYAYPEIAFRADGAAAERAILVAALNAPYYGGAFRVAPEADMGDGRLDLLLLRAPGRRRARAATLGFWRDVALGRHLRRRDLEHRRVRSVEILTPPGIPLQLDGDVLAASPPLRVTLSPHRLKVLTAPPA